MSTVIDGQLDIFTLLDSMLPAADASDSLRIEGVGTLMHPGDLEAMYEARQAHFAEFNVMAGNWKPYRGWAANGSSGAESTHLATSYDAELRCNHHGHRDGQKCLCVGGIVYRVYCHNCEHWTGIYASENEAWEAQLDHCWDGWRELPVLEGRTVGYESRYNMPDDYPKEFIRPGAPIRDCRGLTKYMLRHVPAGSVNGGVKVGVIQDCKQHNQKGEK
ncbi:DUF6349 family protein [Glutamicibacter ardleyensis]|uniref:DUF6349 family protein n=1 Tax=Glutamicibacter ardleyensis TaxID=225894 RepID=UPI003FD116DD